MNGYSVVLQDVCKAFGGLRAVDELSARVPAGCIYGFLGPNGAGKTTTIRMIMSILRPDRGRVEVLGCGAADAPRHRIGYMPEERGLYRRMGVAETLRYFGTIKGLSRRELAAAVPRWLARVGLEPQAANKVQELSRGMHQKLQFAVTCISDPDLLILDEPFAGLDPVNLDLLKDILLDLRRAGKTIIHSTHVMHEAERLCDYLLLINRGRLLFDGTMDQLRSGWRSRQVVARLEGESAFVEAMPAVQAVRREGGQVEFDLADGADPQQLLQALVGRVRVDSFQVKAPSLHEIFVKLVGSDHAENP